SYYIQTASLGKTIFNAKYLSSSILNKTDLLLCSCLFQLSGTRSPPPASAAHTKYLAGARSQGTAAVPPRPQGPAAPSPLRAPPARTPRAFPPPRAGSAHGPAAPHLLLGLAVALQRLLGQVPNPSPRYSDSPYSSRCGTVKLHNLHNGM
uniref:Uncharacterized protein n=1 Tax=Taeniopygia guttata TaxID=59729 RepID=A0A674H5C3_TAEGU